MCSRYAFVPEAAAWVDFRAVLGTLAALPARPRLAPTDTVAVLVQEPGGPPRVIHARWGFVPHWWSKPVLPRLCFNARSEEAAVKPMWKDALRRTRCLVPATSWTEWQQAQGVKVPHRLAPRDGRGFMFAGLWSAWRPRREAEEVATCVILTTAASPGLAHLHERMPAVLAPAAWERWLDPQMADAAGALALLREHLVAGLAAVTVDRH
jgi:putative SOS response-associated peptidase YedK